MPCHHLIIRVSFISPEINYDTIIPSQIQDRHMGDAHAGRYPYVQIHFDPN